MSDHAMKTILVVEDQEEFGMLIGHLLKNAGYQYEYAAHGLEAITRLREGLRPDLILLDIVMPVMDGYEFLEAMDSIDAGSAIPVVMLTALDNAEDVLKAIKLGAADYCTKPIEPADLVGTINRVLDAHQSSIRSTHEPL